jgi:hypothetical protein
LNIGEIFCGFVPTRPDIAVGGHDEHHIGGDAVCRGKMLA